MRNPPCCGPLMGDSRRLKQVAFPGHGTRGRARAAADCRTPHRIRYDPGLVTWPFRPALHRRFLMPLGRLEVTDALGRRVVPLEKPTFSIGRRSGNDLQLVGSDVSRDHADIARENEQYMLRDRGSRYGTFVNGEQITEKSLTHGDLVRLGRSGGAEMVFLLDEQPLSSSSIEKHPSSAVGDLRQIAALLEGLRALGSGRVLDEVLALVMDSAIEVTGAERGFIMLANADARARVQDCPRPRPRDAAGQELRDQPQDPRGGLLDRAGARRRRPARQQSGLRAQQHRRARHPPRAVHAAAARALSRSGRHAQRGEAHRRAVSRQPREGRRALARGARGARDARDRGGRRDRERAAVPRDARQGQDGAGDAHRGRHPARAAARRRSGWAASSRPMGASVPCRSIGGDFFDYVDLPEWRVRFRGRRRRRQGRAGGAAHGGAAGRLRVAGVERHWSGDDALARQPGADPPLGGVALRDGVLRRAHAATGS